MKQKLLTWLSPLLLAIALSACEKAPEQIALEGKTMGTTYHIKYINDGTVTNLPSPKEVQQQLDMLLKEVNNQMSTYQKDSQISQFNTFEHTDSPFNVATDFATVVQEAIRLNHVTQGALDVTVGPLVNLWGFGPDKRLNKVPSDELIAERSAYVGIDKLAVGFTNNDPQNGKGFLIKKHPKVYIDLSSIAKGFGVDKVAQHLEKLGLQRYLVEIGGEIYGKGTNLQNHSWNIAIEKPEFSQGTSVQITVPLHNLGMATSGNYRNYFEDEQGNRLSHIIDPKIKRPITHNLASITVFAPTTMTADGLSTGLYVLGAEKALELAEKEKLAIFLIIKNGDTFETKMSSEFQKLIEQK
ncbi:thiamine biosynthesis protein ApbE [Pasteurellaceae bacterium Macca]|nr:thiamine biosynthesis protein ApbE [Pasteurellaceae bacterium Macca]